MIRTEAEQRALASTGHEKFSQVTKDDIVFINERAEIAEKQEELDGKLANTFHNAVDQIINFIGASEYSYNARVKEISDYHREHQESYKALANDSSLSFEERMEAQKQCEKDREMESKEIKEANKEHVSKTMKFVGTIGVIVLGGIAVFKWKS